MAADEIFEGGCLCGAIRYVWTNERVSWFEVDDRLPRFPESSSAVPSKARES